MNHCDRRLHRWGKDKAGYQRWRCPACKRIISENPNTRGRPMLGDKPMTAAERKRRSRKIGKATKMTSKQNQYTDLVASCSAAVPNFYTADSSAIRAFSDIVNELYAAMALSCVNGATLLVRCSGHREVLVSSVYGITDQGFSTFIRCKTTTGQDEGFAVESILEIEEVPKATK